MHQLAYEIRNGGAPVPKDESRPISVFGVKIERFISILQHSMHLQMTSIQMVEEWVHLQWKDWKNYS